VFWFGFVFSKRYIRVPLLLLGNLARGGQTNARLEGTIDEPLQTRDRKEKRNK
jgi:hypothetical protein